MNKKVRGEGEGRSPKSVDGVGRLRACGKKIGVFFTIVDLKRRTNIATKGEYNINNY